MSPRVFEIYLVRVADKVSVRVISRAVNLAPRPHREAA
jgi:hypothetical protein